MIPVRQQPEPASFDQRVRQKGMVHLQRKGLALDRPLPAGTEIDPYWRDCLDDLHRAYGGICAYLCVFVERCTGGNSTDHFIAKSERADLAYEWANYRLACSTMNSRKRDYDDVLDPFLLAADLFRIELSTGRIYPNPHLEAQAVRIVEATIERLGLDDPACREMRARWFHEHLTAPLPADYLRLKSPLVWQEARRQALLNLD